MFSRKDLIVIIAVLIVICTGSMTGNFFFLKQIDTTSWYVVQQFNDVIFFVVFFSGTCLIYAITELLTKHTHLNKAPRYLIFIVLFLVVAGTLSIAEDTITNKLVRSRILKEGETVKSVVSTRKETGGGRISRVYISYSFITKAPNYEKYSITIDDGRFVAGDTIDIIYLPSNPLFNIISLSKAKK